MRKTILILFIALCMISCTDEKIQPDLKPTAQYDLYLMIGQSNMVGYAPLEPADTAVISGVYLLDREGEIIPASAPLNRFSTVRFMGQTYYGLGSAFAKKMRFETGHYILLVANARGGSAVMEWQKDCAYNFYSEAVRRTREALAYPGVTLKGILWHQGESDCTRTNFEEYYYRILGDIVDDFRADFGIPDLPFVVGETYYGATYANQMNPVIRKVQDYIPYSDWVSAEGCGTLGDNIHFSHDGYDILGDRYAEKIIGLCAR